MGRLHDRPLLPGAGWLAALLLGGLLALGGVAGAAAPAAAKAPPIVPAREIRQMGSGKVGWQVLWANARDSVRRGDFPAAVRQYEQLLAIAPDLEEARWELTKIRLRAQDWDKAAEQLELLLEANPDRVAYLDALAAILQKKAYYGRALELFGRAVKNDGENVESLVGMVQSLVKLRRQEEALPFLQKLHRLRPADRGIQRDLARIAFETGHFEIAAPHLRELAAAPDSDVPLLEMAAKAHEHLGLDNLAAAYRERIVALQPDNRESHDWLAAYYERTGQTEEALAHFKVLLAKDGANPTLLHTIGRLLEDGGHFAEALPYFERYLAVRPRDRKVLGTMVDLHAALGEKAATLGSLEQLLAVDPRPDTGKVKLAAKLYAEAGRYEEAIPLFRRVLAADPGDRESMVALAAALTATGEDGSALALWQQLAKAEPDHLEPLRAMAKILERQKQYEELRPVLEKLHGFEPGNQEVTLRLAAVDLECGQVEKGGELLEQVPADTPLRQELLAIRGRYFEKVRQPAHALDSYEKLAELTPSAPDVRLTCVRLAGELGELAVVRRHLALLDLDHAEPDVVLTVAKALAGCGVYDEALALYRRQMPAAGEEDAAGRQRVLLAVATLYRKAGLPYEAAQAYRTILPMGQDVAPALRGLFAVAIDSGELDEAEVWLSHLTGVITGPEHDLLQARLLSARGDHLRALEMGRQAAAELQAAGAEPQADTDFALARLLLAAGHFTEARRQCRAIDPSRELERLVLLQQIAAAGGDTAEGSRLQAAALSLASQDAGALLRLASLYRHARLEAAALKAARQAAAAAPDSLRARMLLAAALEEKGDLQGALAEVREITGQYPAHPAAVALEAKLLFRTGDFQAATALAEKADRDDPFFPELQLLKGRGLWRLHQRQQSLAAYEEFLKPTVSDLFEKESAARKVYYVPEKPTLTIWQLLSYKNYAPSAFTDRVMAPDHAADNGSERQRDLNAIAAPLYALYKWQVRFADELAARRSIDRREYFLAKRQFETLLQKYPDDEMLMFDLAGLYSHFGDLGKEAALYRRMDELNPDFSGLAGAEERNRLKRRPRSLLVYENQREEGRDGYKAIHLQQGKAAFWYSPAIQQEVELTVTRLRYESTENDQSIAASRAQVSFHTDYNDNLSFKVGGGVEELAEGHAGTGLLDCKVTGRIGDKWKSYVAVVRDVTRDTLASITRNIVHQDLRTGLGIDVLPRLLTGADYSYNQFSDENVTSGYDLWTSYIILPEPTFLKVGYTYDFKDSQEGAAPGPPLADGFAANDHPYWAPVNYWVNQFSVYFKHQLSKETFDRGVPRYYTLEYSLGHDSGGEGFQTFRGGFYLEWTPRLLTEAAAEATTSKPYRDSSLSLSAIYRW